MRTLAAALEAALNEGENVEPRAVAPRWLPWAVTVVGVLLAAAALISAVTHP